MTLPSFPSLESAARACFPPESVKIIASRTQGEHAYVLFDTRPDRPSYLYGVSFERGPEGWTEGGSSNGGGWRVSEPDAELGTLVEWDNAPEGADRVRVALGTDVHEEPVEHGVFLSAWWRVPIPDGVWPRLVAYRAGGAWHDLS